MIDGGLWTACKESWAVMERTYNHQKWDSIRKAYPAYRKLWKDTLLDRMSFDTPSPPPPPRPRRSPRERPPTSVDPYDAVQHDYSSVPATAFFWPSRSLPCSASNGVEEADHARSQAAASPYYFTVRPMRDLIIIRPTAWASYLSEGYWYAFEHGFSFGA
ncbi:hypothetical protein B0T09DRAFT_15780 [Sordaria sp. MPI-SDFR-AT-0083]|nr:hypothetical protein B0T09DRAFT_15780 [Sordaria sp. MPI-SDFR-AT-0083]